MKGEKNVERLIAERWPKLKKRAQIEDDPEKLIAIIEEIDDLLFMLEMRIHDPQTENMLSRANGNSHQRRQAAVSSDSQIGS
jgi:hypothetical protein